MDMKRCKGLVPQFFRKPSIRQDQEAAYKYLGMQPPPSEKELLCSSTSPEKEILQNDVLILKLAVQEQQKHHLRELSQGQKRNSFLIKTAYS